jgi:riboflavin biosynthesis pyrimidine reductase
MEGYGDIALPLALREAREHAGDSPVPHLALVTESGDIPSGLSIDTTWVVTTDSARARATLGPTWHSRIFVAGERHLDPRAIVSQLTSVGLSRVLCEGGPSIADAFFASDVVDDYCLTTSTVRGGDNSPLAPAVPRAMTCAHRLEGGSFVMERWAYAHKRESQYPL